MPSLRERPEDVAIHAEAILAKLAREWNEAPLALAADALETLRNYGFEGNVRELENILERAMTLSEGDSICAEDLYLRETSNAADRTVSADATIMPARGGQDLETFLEEVEKEAIVKALEATRYNKTAAAKKLGISFRALRYRLKKIGIE
jgi:two-component system response regulator PilR (NtrC family)